MDDLPIRNPARGSHERKWPGRLLVVGTEGATVVEYVLILGVVVVGLAISAHALSYATRESLSFVTTVMESPGTSVAAANNAVSNQRTPGRAARPVKRMDWIQRWQVGGIVLSLILNVVLWCLLYRRSRQEKQEAADDVVPDEIQHQNLFAKRQQISHILNANRSLILQNELKVRHLMSRDVVTAAPHESAEDLTKIMEEHHVRHLVVLDSQGVLVGIVTAEDALNQPDKSARTLAKSPISVEPTMPVAMAVTMLLNARGSCLPVLHDGQLQGVLTSSDILMALQCILQFVESCAGNFEHDEPRTRTISELVRAQEGAPNVDPAG